MTVTAQLITMSPRGEGCSELAFESEENRDSADLEMEMAMLSHHFQSFPFSKIWKHLQKMGWKYTSPKYHAPLPNNNNDEGIRWKVFADATEVLEFLDEVALEDLHSNLQSTNLHHTDNPNTQSLIQDRDLARKWRRDLLTEIYKAKKQNGFEEKKVESMEWDVSYDEDDHLGDGTEAESQQRRSSRRSKSSSKLTLIDRTATAVEKGTDLYLHRKSRKKKKDPVQTNDPSLMEHALKTSNMSPRECMSIARDVMEQQASSISENSVYHHSSKYHDDFSEWRFLLSTNHSVLLHGSGSKKELLNQFADKELSLEGHVILIDGFDESLTGVDEIFDLLVDVFLDGEEPEKLPAVSKDHGSISAPAIGLWTPYKAHGQVERGILLGRAIAHRISDADRHADVERTEDENVDAVLPIFLVIHNLDAPNLSKSIDQDALSQLLVNSHVSNSVASIRLVASVDHVDAPLHLWGVQTAANFAWIYKSVHTHVPYTEEMSLLSHVESKSRKSADVTKALETVQAGRVVEVLKHLAPRHAEIVKILAKLQLEAKKPSSHGKGRKWIDHKLYLKTCQDRMAINKDSQLRQYLSELSDHGLVVSKVQGSVEVVQIPYDDKKLQEILTYDKK